MAKTRYETVDAYIEAQPEPVRPLLERIRATIRKAVPEAEESISYQMPGYKLGGKPVLYFAAWKQHYSLYPVNEELMKAVGEDPEEFEIAKGTLRFPLEARVPVRLIARLAKARANGATYRPRARARPRA